jgi:hypothetical protein
VDALSNTEIAPNYINVAQLFDELDFKWNDSFKPRKTLRDAKGGKYGINTTHILIAVYVTTY